MAGFDIRHQTAEVRRLIGVVCHQVYLYGQLTSAENLEFYAKLQRLPAPRERAREQLRSVGLEKQADVAARDLSRGMLQRLALARALLHDPRILLLDEPDTGLDQRWMGVLAELVAEGARRGRTTILSTHNLERSLDLADHVIMLNAGRIAFSARRSELDVGSLKEAYARFAGTSG